METNKILQGDALEVLKTLPSESINCCVTSPPYWALRDYGVEGQLGLEKDFNEYIDKLCNIFDEVKRVLRKDGTLWVNIGDTYNSLPAGNKKPSGFQQNRNIEAYTQTVKINKKIDLKISDKSLCNIPARFSIEMQNRGWILRNVIIWYKPNCMPCSVKDRFTVDFEYVYFFVKNKKYWFEQQLEPVKEISLNRANYSWNCDRPSTQSNNGIHVKEMGNRFVNKDGRNKRAVWTVSTKPYKEAHFATYPKELIEPMIKAGCPEFVCNKCGFVKEKIIKKIGDSADKTKGNYAIEMERIGNLQKSRASGFHNKIEIKVKGYTSCNCNEKFSGGIVLDPFFGSGTTGLVALQQNKRFIGIELNQKYIDIANKRLKPILEQTRLYKLQNNI